jgi:hypothetical protein
MISRFNAYIDKTNFYSFNNCWNIDAPLEQSWNELIKYKKWPAWCDAIEKIEPLSRIDHLKKGDRIRSVWKGTLPYSISFDAILKDITPYSFLSFNVMGDLCGEGTCHFLQSNENTMINFIWNIPPTKLWMRMSSPFARHLFIGNHDLIMEQAVTGFARMIEHKNSL